MKNTQETKQSKLAAKWSNSFLFRLFFIWFSLLVFRLKVGEQNYVSEFILAHLSQQKLDLTGIIVEKISYLIGLIIIGAKRNCHREEATI